MTYQSLRFIPAWTPGLTTFLTTFLFLSAVLLVAIASPNNRLDAAPPRVLPEGKLPDDVRLGPLKDLNGYFPFTPPKRLEEWTRRSEQLRRQILVANGLWPMPERTPPHAVVHGRVYRDDYTVDRVHLQSYPGHYVTGSLYKPKGKSGKLPVVLCPHGHWDNGRFYDAGEVTVKKQIEQGAERFEVSGRHPLQARCVQLARMGCAVFHYDMLGYADSVQIPLSVAHKFRERRPHMEGEKEWGFFSPQAELHLQSIMGLQTYNSIRALDWLCELPEIDATRVGVTGASGGGTQTFLLAAIDPRVTAAFPAVMVSTAMQGGCTCENCNYLRVGTGNVELAALIAPRPLGMTAANDWTKEMPTKGFPELQQLYKLLGKPENVMLAANLQFGHNYNAPSRDAMYGWFNKHLKLGIPEPIVERDFVPLTIEEATVWNEEHPKPSGEQIGEAHEKKLLAAMAEASSKQMETLFNESVATPHATELNPKAIDYRRTVGGGWEVLIGRGLPAPGEVKFEQLGVIEREGYAVQRGLINFAKHLESLPTIMLVPSKPAKASAAGGKGDNAPRQHRVLWFSTSGKDGLHDADGNPRRAIKKLLDAGATVVGVDLFGQGEFVSDKVNFKLARQVREHRNFVGFTYGYNSPLFAKRVHDVMSVVACVNDLDDEYEVSVVGLDGAAGWVAAASASAGRAVHRVAVDDKDDRIGIVSGLDDPDLLPGAAKYGGLPALMALDTSHHTFISGSASTVEKARLVFRQMTTKGRLATVHSDIDVDGIIAGWILTGSIQDSD